MEEMRAHARHKEMTTIYPSQIKRCDLELFFDMRECFSLLGIAQKLVLQELSGP